MRHDAVATHRSAFGINGTISLRVWRLRQWGSAIGVRFAAWATAATGLAVKTRRNIREQSMIILSKCDAAAIHFQVARLLGDGYRTISSSQTPWESANFSGQRHQLMLMRDTPLDRRSERRLSATIADHEFAFTDAIIADAHLARVSPDGRMIAIDVLSVEV